MRINQFLAHFAGLSRRAADRAIDAGRVKVNNQPASKGQQIADTDSVSIDDDAVASSEYTYLLFNKPTGYVTSRQQQGSQKIIYELLPKKYHHLKPVGRLDKDTSGLLLLTNDGEYAEQLTHPKNNKLKIYRLEVDKVVDASNLALIQGPGVTLDDGLSTMSVRQIKDNQPHYEIIISEGRNRQIRRTFDALGYKIIKLHRTQFGPYKLDKLQPKEFGLVSKL